jgi:tyrosine phenol-lyase
MQTIIEPFRIKSVEPIYFNTREQREDILKKAFYNPFLIKSTDVLIDLLTDSGTSAMSSQQWAGIMQGDESYAGSPSFFRFEHVVQQITGMPLVIPTHQGRAAEKILFSIIGGKGKFIVSNTLFDTTRANIEYSGAVGVDLLCAEGKLPSVPAPFKGNMDTVALERFIADKGAANIPLVIITVTNNSGGGQPVSMQNVREVKRICAAHNIPLFIDACRFAENAWFIKIREEGYATKTVEEIARELFSYADGCTMSGKKDALVNIGGWLSLNDDALADKARNLVVVYEGLHTYGGMAGRDMEAMARGIGESVQDDHMRARIGQVEYLGELLQSAGVPIVLPIGGHAIYLDARRFYPDVPQDAFPAQMLAAELYLDAGVRAMERGIVSAGRDGKTGKHHYPKLELVRLTIPRRVYTQAHMDVVAESVEAVYQQPEKPRGLRMVYEPEYLRFFQARFEPILPEPAP